MKVVFLINQSRKISQDDDNEISNIVQNSEK